MVSYAQDVVEKYSTRPSGDLYPDPIMHALDRAKNGYAAVKLLPLFLNHPIYWRATSSMPLPRPTILEFLSDWKKLSAEKEAVEAISATLLAET
jgi:hypothetical protein